VAWAYVADGLVVSEVDGGRADRDDLERAEPVAGRAPDGPATDDEYEAKLAALAEVINQVAPDVMALQEVGPEQVLADLNQACTVDFDHRLIGSEDRRGIRVALMSPRRLSHRGNVQAFPPGVLLVQYRDTVFDPATTSMASRGILSATVGSGGEACRVS
jgi:endonuclease/exonuclease/phosphatase family metal-dependent hydrolase